MLASYASISGDPAFHYKPSRPKHLSVQEKLSQRIHSSLYASDSQLRMQTIVRLRWVGVIGQILALSVVYYGLGFDLPVRAASSSSPCRRG